MADLFEQMDQLFRNQKPEGTVPVYVLHRFLASEAAFAPVVKELSKIWDDEMVVEIWRTILPKSRSAPRLKYVAPKKPPAVEALVEKIATQEAWTLLEAEEAVLMLQRTGRLPAALQYYGIEDTAKEKKERKKK